MHPVSIFISVCQRTLTGHTPNRLITCSTALLSPVTRTVQSNRNWHLTWIGGVKSKTFCVCDVHDSKLSVEICNDLILPVILARTAGHNVGQCLLNGLNKFLSSNYGLVLLWVVQCRWWCTWGGITLLAEVGLRIMIQSTNSVYETGKWAVDVAEFAMIALKENPIVTDCSDYRTCSKGNSEDRYMKDRNENRGCTLRSDRL